MAESSFASGHDCHVFIHNVTKTPYTYYGRAIPIREQINPPGTPSRFVLFLPEYAEYKKEPRNLRENLSDVFYDEYIGPTEKQNIQTIRTRQSDYRKKVLSLWNGQCAVTGVDETVNLNLRYGDYLVNAQCSIATKLPEDGYLYGEDGYIVMKYLHLGNTVKLYGKDRKLLEEFVQEDVNGFIYQVEEAIRCIENGELESKIASHQMTLDCCKIFDDCLNQ